MAEMESDAEAKSKPWQWPLEWWHDEKFWRDVASRAVAGIIVVFVGYAVAVASGLLGFPDLRQVVAVIIVWAAGCAVLFVLGYASRKIIAVVQRRAGTKLTRRTLLTVWGLIYLLLMGTWLVLLLNISKWAYEYFQAL